MLKSTWLLNAGCLLALILTPHATLAESLVQIHTPLGDMLTALYDEDKPVTVANFKQYITSGRFRDTIVQRWESGFVIQGGGVYVTNRSTANAQFIYLTPFATITNEYSVGRTFSNTYGTIAMARAGGKTNSASSPWFFNLGNNSFLDAVDGGFTVFGRVLVGTNVLERFRNPPGTSGIWWFDLQDPAGMLTELPALSSAPTFKDLVYTDFSLPTWPRVTVLVDHDGDRRVTWNSISNFVNHLEFAPGLPPVWQALAETNGTGSEMQYIHSRPAGGAGFYRVRIQ